MKNYEMVLWMISKKIVELDALKIKILEQQMDEKRG